VISVECEFCHYENPNNVKICLKCGKELININEISISEDLTYGNDIEFENNPRWFC